MLSIHLPSYISVHALSYSVIIINQSIHINLSAGAQNITGANIIMLVCRRLLTMRLPGKASLAWLDRFFFATQISKRRKSGLAMPDNGKQLCDSK